MDPATIMAAINMAQQFKGGKEKPAPMPYQPIPMGAAPQPVNQPSMGRQIGMGALQGAMGGAFGGGGMLPGALMGALLPAIQGGYDKYQGNKMKRGFYEDMMGENVMGRQ
jgi:hypothetical protein